MRGVTVFAARQGDQKQLAFFPLYTNFQKYIREQIDINEILWEDWCTPLECRDKKGFDCYECVFEEAGLEQELEDAEYGDTNVKVWVKYLDLNKDDIDDLSIRRRNDFARDDQGKIILFKDKKEAEEWIRKNLREFTKEQLKHVRHLKHVRPLYFCVK